MPATGPSLRSLIRSAWTPIAPAGTPPEAAKKLEAEAIAALKSKELSGKLADQGFTVVGSTSQQFAAFMKSEVPRWAKLIKDANIRAD